MNSTRRSTPGGTKSLGGSTGLALVAGLVFIALLSAGCIGPAESDLDPEIGSDGQITWRDDDGNVVVVSDPLPEEDGEFAPGDPSAGNTHEPDVSDKPGKPNKPDKPDEPEAAKPAAPQLLVGAGDIAKCTDTAEQTAKVIDRIFEGGAQGQVFTAGDNAYESGSAAEYKNCFDPSWGRHKSRMRPALGNHEYGTKEAAGYFNYFGDVAGEKGKGWYSYDIGSWHVVVLNSNCGKVGCDDGSEQLKWLKADLKANPSKCIGAVWHHPRFSSGGHGDTPEMAPAWQALMDAGAEWALVGHDHHYERFKPMDAKGNATPKGIRQFLVGSGGAPFRGLSKGKNVEIQNNKDHGVMKLTLHEDRYDWEFMPVAGKSFTDKGSDVCR